MQKAIIVNCKKTVCPLKKGRPQSCYHPNYRILSYSVTHLLFNAEATHCLYQQRAQRCPSCSLHRTLSPYRPRSWFKKHYSPHQRIFHIFIDISINRLDLRYSSSQDLLFQGHGLVLLLLQYLLQQVYCARHKV